MFARFRSAAATVAFAVVTTTAAPALAQGIVANAADPYVHKGVAVEFPQETGKFERGRVVEYDADGTDASVGYGISGMVGELTVYLYPVREASCTEEFETAKGAIVNRGGSKQVKSAPALSMSSFGDAPQNSATFNVKAGGYGFNHPKLISYLWVGCPAGDKWLVKYRGSFSAEDAEAAGGLAEELFSTIDWSAVTGE